MGFHDFTYSWRSQTEKNGSWILVLAVRGKFLSQQLGKFGLVGSTVQGPKWAGEHCWGLDGRVAVILIRTLPGSGAGEGSQVFLW